MENLINSRVREIEISGIRKFYNYVSKYEDVVSLTIGQPDFPTPEHIKEAGKLAIDKNRTVYTHNAGIMELREAASSFIEKRYGMHYSPEDEIIITNGASEAIDMALRTILEEGSEIIMPSPVYPGYEPVIRLCGGIPVHIDTTSNGFKLNAELIKEKLTPKTRCLILPYPSNPTGCTLPMDDLIEIRNLLSDKDIFILSDEIYSELVYEGEHSSIASLPGMREKTIIINGLSKSHSMTGWRIGFTLAPSYITKHMLKVHQYNATCASSIGQYAALEALTNGLNDPEAMREEYIKRRDYVYERLVKIGLEVEKPSGAFYIFPSIKKFNVKSFDFAIDLLEKERLAVVPGDAFSPAGEGFIRLSFACSMETLQEALDRLERYIKSISIC